MTLLHPLHSSCPTSSWEDEGFTLLYLPGASERGIQMPTGQRKGESPCPIYQHHSLGPFLSNQGLMINSSRSERYSLTGSGLTGDHIPQDPLGKQSWKK